MAGRYKRPATPAERERREQAAADKLTALHERLAEQVASLRSGKDWRRWLEVAQRFHTYSFNNVLLIAAQRPGATAVAGYEAWRALGRQVDKGERGIQILAPVVRRPRADEQQTDTGSDGSDPRATARPGSAPADAQNPGEDDQARAGRVAGFRVTYVWDVSQTTGQPLPERPRPQLLTGQAPPGLWDSLAQLVADRGFALERGDCGAANGWTDYTARTVRVRADVDDAQAVKTLAHEVGHVLLHDPADFPSAASGAGLPSTPSTTGTAGTAGGTTAGCRGGKEVEAESVAYLVAASHDLNTDGYTFAYVTGWAADVDSAEPERVVRDTGQRVLSAARTVLAATAPDTAKPADESLAARVQAGAERTAAAQQHADTTLALATQPPATQSTPAAAPAPDVESLLQLHADAAEFYAGQLTGSTPEAARARAVLEERAVPAAAATNYGLGYAPPSWTALTDHLRGRGYTDPQLLAAGVGMTTRRGTVVDRFRDRLMLPVHDPGGQHVVGFLGRALTPDDSTPKYLNGPETALYRKSDVLYGLGAEPARAALAAGARPVLVEGALDAIAVTTAGNGRHVGVAPSGTALTPGQVAVLERAAGPLATRGVTVAFDPDPAGQAAALRADALLRAAGVDPRAVQLPDGQDPASLAQHAGPAALHAALEAARPLADLVVDDRLARWADRLQWVEGRIGAVHDVAPLLATLPAGQVGRQVARVAEQLGVDHATVTGAVVDAVIRDGDAPGRLQRRDRRDDLDRGQSMTSAHSTGQPTTAPQLARAAFPAPLHAAVTRNSGAGNAEPTAAARPPAPAVGWQPPTSGART